MFTKDGSKYQAGFRIIIEPKDGGFVINYGEYGGHTEECVRTSVNKSLKIARLFLNKFHMPWYLKIISFIGTLFKTTKPESVPEA